jgi:hypothetical protein
MAFQVSPAVTVSEVDLTNIIPTVSTSNGGTVGQFQWGPVEEVTIVENEDGLVSQFGKPNSTNYKDFFCASSFLSYASNLKVVRVIDETGDSNTAGGTNASATASATGSGQLIKNRTVYENTSFSASFNLWIAKYPGALGNSIGVAWTDTAGFNATDSNGDPSWPWHDLFTDAPASNEYHVVVYDFDGTITGTASTALETFAFVSTTSTASYFDGSSGYFATKINTESEWIWVGKTSLMTGSNDGIQLGGGSDGLAIGTSERQTGIDLFANSETVDISLLFVGGADTTSAKYAIDNIGEVRKDCLILVSVEEDDTVGVYSTTTALSNILTTRTTLGTSSYAVMDSAYKYTYDRYNDTYRWVPLNGDIAGLIAKTDNDYDPWFSPAGFNKGRIKNALKLSLDQTKTTRDELYKKGVNPCTVFPIEGPILFGDKTLLTKPSAFDRINVRRLFIVLEKAISTAANYMLFEQNDAFTRARFLNMVEPFLRDVQARRGITDFRIICDATNNTGEVIDRGEFVCDIYIKPTRSINFIQLNFVAVRTGVAFEEIVLTGGTNPGSNNPLTI